MLGMNCGIRIEFVVRWHKAYGCDDGVGFAGGVVVSLQQDDNSVLY